MRLDKFVCKSTALTKAQAIAAITRCDVTVNSEVITDITTQVHENNDVTLLGERLYPRPFRYLLMHKPPQTICSNIDEVYPSLFNYIDIERLQEITYCWTVRCRYDRVGADYRRWSMVV